MHEASSEVRLPAVAGSFYPADPTELEGTVRDHLRRARRPDGTPKAVITPHAGYVYSGPVAATAYAALQDRQPAIERVVLLGPSHRVYLEGMAAPSVPFFRTPLGDVRIDHTAISSVLDLPGVATDDQPHAREHSLEVHLPFLQVVLGDFSLVPFSVGNASAEQVAAVLDRLWGGPETLIVISSDLSHYLPYDQARELDARTTRAIEELDPDGLSEESACGRVPIRGLLLAARRRGLACRTVDLRSSGDTAGNRNRVVGYGSWFLAEPDALGVAESTAPPTVTTTAAPVVAADASSDERALRDRIVLEVATRSVDQAVRTGKPLLVDPARFPAALRDWRAAFVTINKQGKLRGCIGDLEAFRPLVVSVADGAYRAALNDPRFEPIGETELAELELHVSLLTPMEPLPVTSEADLLARLRPGIDGLTLRDGKARATFLPAVWETLPEPRDFLVQLKRKAGWSPDHWSPSLEVYRYEAESVG